MTRNISHFFGLADLDLARYDTSTFVFLSWQCLRVVNSSLWMKTVNKCNVFNCNGNYNDENKHRVFRLPKDQIERQLWINKLPPLKDFVIDATKFRSVVVRDIGVLDTLLKKFPVVLPVFNTTNSVKCANFVFSSA